MVGLILSHERFGGDPLTFPIEAYSKLVPETVALMQGRYRVLHYIKMVGPIGRRTLGEMANLTERETRTMIELLRDQQLIQVSKKGVTVTAEGLEALEALAPIMEQWTGRAKLKERLEQHFGIAQIVIVAGDSDEQASTKNDLGLKTAELLAAQSYDEAVVAVTGGSTIATIPQYIKQHDVDENILFIAARGGVGQHIELQATVIAAIFAEACGGKYESFYYPESLSEETLKAFRNEPSVQKMIQQYDHTDCLIHGIGEAQRMASLRESSTDEKTTLEQSGAKGEAFGYYFDEFGKAVHRIRSIGIQLEQVQKIPHIYAVAGGASKAEAIAAYLQAAPKQTVLVTDEAAAQAIYEKITNNI